MRDDISSIASRPFLFTADTAWMLLYRLGPSDVKLYFRDRESKGFSAILVQLLSDDREGRTTDGHSPLLEPGRLYRPSPRFFEHAVRMVKAAQTHHLLVAIAPVWLGCCKGGWRDVLLAAGPDKARELGRYIGKQFAALPNVMWILGGDHDQDQYYAVVDALARGIREQAPHQLMMAHAGPPIRLQTCMGRHPGST